MRPRHLCAEAEEVHRKNGREDQARRDERCILSFRLIEAVWNYALLMLSEPSAEGTLDYHKLLCGYEKLVSKFRFSHRDGFQL